MTKHPVFIGCLVVIAAMLVYVPVEGNHYSFGYRLITNMKGYNVDITRLLIQIIFVSISGYLVAVIYSFLRGEKGKSLAEKITSVFEVDKEGIKRINEAQKDRKLNPWYQKTKVGEKYTESVGNIKSGNEVPNSLDPNLRKLGQYHKLLQWMLPIYFVSSLVLASLPETGALLTITFMIAYLCLFYKYAQYLGDRFPWLTSAMLFIPFVGYYVLYRAMVRGNRIFRSNGIKVGFMGAKI